MRHVDAKYHLRQGMGSYQNIHLELKLAHFKNETIQKKILTSRQVCGEKMLYVFMFKVNNWNT